MPLNVRYREQWHQADDRSDFQWKIAPTWRAQHVVIEFIFFVPETKPAQIVHGGRDTEKMFEELGRDIFVNVIFTGKFNRDSHQVQRKHSHPARDVALIKVEAIAERCIAIEHA